jgi:hypothetical protein
MDATTLLIGILPAVLSGLIAFAAATWRLRGEIEQQRAGDIATLRQRYVNPLRYWATRLGVRLFEIEAKFSDPDEDAKVRLWFQKLKNHADGSGIRHDFRGWCYFKGIFAMTALSAGSSTPTTSSRSGRSTRMLDVFIDAKRLTIPKIVEIRARLDALITFLDSERTPEWGRPARPRAWSRGRRFA